MDHESLRRTQHQPALQMTPLIIAQIECLSQFAKGPVCDGDLISKAHRDGFHKAGWIDRAHGWNFLNAEGIRICEVLSIITTNRRKKEAEP